MMKLYFTEQDWEDDYNSDYDSSTYYYEVDYITYYKNEYEYECPLTEIDKSYDDDMYIDDDAIDPIKAVEQEEATIEEDVKLGKYPGLYVHHIKVEIDSNYSQIDVDRWTGSSSIVSVDCDSVELDMPDDWNEDSYTMADLAEYAEYVLEQ